MPETQNQMTTTAASGGLTGAQQAVQKMQQDVMKFVTKMLGKERAAEFATRVALIARENPKLMQAIQNNPESFLTAYMASATYDLMPNTPEGLAYLIPYGDKVQFQLGYKGLITLARRSGEIMSISAENVFKGDEFDVELGTERRIVHKPSFETDRTKYENITHAYATAKLSNGEQPFVVMTKGEIDKIKKTVKATSTDTPWNQWGERQSIKTVLKRFTQVLPSGTDSQLVKAAQTDSLAEAGKLKFDRNSGEFIEGELVEVPEATRNAINTAESTEDLQEILDSLSVPERKKAAPLVAERIKAL